MLIDINEIIVNDRTYMNPENYKNLATSIGKHGLISPIVIDQDYNIIDGVRRLLACKYLGWKMVEVCVVATETLDEATREELGISEQAPKWTPKTLRKALPKPNRKDRKPCFICGDHKNITEVHHLVQLSELADLLNKGIANQENITSTIVWLCPNCHAYVHAAMRGDTDTVLDVYMSPKWRERYEELNSHRFSAIHELIG